MQQEQSNGYRVNDSPASVWLLFGSIAATFVVMIAVVLQASPGVMAGPLLAAIGAG